MTDALTIRQRVLDDILAHARREAPNECCGLLIGGAGRIVDSVPASNMRSSPTAYLIDPADHFAAIRRARAAGTEVVGAYHSHPASEARPSPTDLAEALGGGFFYLILSLRPGRGPAVGLFVLDGGNFVPCGFVPCPT